MQCKAVLIAVLASLAIAAPGRPHRRGTEERAVRPRDPSYPAITQPPADGYPANPYPLNPLPNPYQNNPHPSEPAHGEEYPVTRTTTLPYLTTRTTTKPYQTPSTSKPTTTSTTTTSTTTTSTTKTSTTTRPYSTTTIPEGYPQNRPITTLPAGYPQNRPTTTIPAGYPQSRPTTTTAAYSQRPPQSGGPPPPPAGGGQGKNKACGSSQPMCCETTLLDIAGVSCKPSSNMKQSAKDLQKECASTGFTAKCCAATLLDLPIGVVCTDPLTDSKKGRV